MRLLEVHDLVVTKLLRMHAKDRRDVETLTRHPSFSATLLVERYRAAREELKMYWPDKVGKADTNLNAVLVDTLGEPAIRLWGDEESGQSSGPIDFFFGLPSFFCGSGSVPDGAMRPGTVRP